MVRPKFDVAFDSFHLDRNGAPNDGEQVELTRRSNSATSHSFSPNCWIRLMLKTVCSLIPSHSIDKISMKGLPSLVDRIER